MTRDEWMRLRGYWYAKRNAPWTNATGRRHAKGRAQGVGQVLKKSFIKPSVHLEKLFLSHP